MPGLLAVKYGVIEHSAQLRLRIPLRQDSQLFLSASEIPGETQKFEEEGALGDVGRVVTKMCGQSLLRLPHFACVEKLFGCHRPSFRRHEHKENPSPALLEGIIPS